MAANEWTKTSPGDYRNGSWRIFQHEDKTWTSGKLVDPKYPEDGMIPGTINYRLGTLKSAKSAAHGEDI